MSVTEATRRAEAYAVAVDDLAPGRLAGLYLVGSTALGDWQEKVSNIDVVAVSDGPWAAVPAEAAAAHHLLEVGGRPARVAFLTYEELAGDPSAASAACFEGGRRIASEEFATPLTWTILADDAVAVRGTEYFPVNHGSDELRRWAAARLAGPWRHWAVEAAARPGRLWRRRSLSEDILEVTRLHVAATRGQAVSKLRSATMALDDLPGRFERIVADATGYRRGLRTSMYWGPLERRRHALDLVAELTTRAAGQGQ